jgi:hypothetical protein
MTEQAAVFKDDARPDMAALADEVLRASGTTNLAFIRMTAAAPGIAEKVDLGDGAIDQSLVTDADILATVQAVWPTVAALFYDAEGIPLVEP